MVKVEDLQHLYRPCIKQFQHFPTLKFSDDCGSPFNDRVELTVKKKSSTRLTQKGGYCEICDHWFEFTMSEHLQSERHKRFASDPGNFISLGKIINDLPDLTKFLSKYCSSDGRVFDIGDKMEEESTLEKESALELLSDDVDQVLKDIGPNFDFDLPMETDSTGSETESYDIEKLLSDKQLINSPNIENVVDTCRNVEKVDVSNDNNDTGMNSECHTPNTSGDIINDGNSDRDSSLSAINLRQKFMKWTIHENVDSQNIIHDDKFIHNENDIIKSIKAEAVFSSTDHCFETNGIQDIISYLQQDSPQALNEVADFVTDQHSKGIPDDENHRRLKAIDNDLQPMLHGCDDSGSPFSETSEAANNLDIGMEHDEGNGSHSMWQTNAPEVDCIGVGSEIEIACEVSHEELPPDDVCKMNESSLPAIHIEIPYNRLHEKSEIQHDVLTNDTDVTHCAVTCQHSDGLCSPVEKVDGTTDQTEVPSNGPVKQFNVSCSDASSRIKTHCNVLPCLCESLCHNEANQIKSTCNVLHNQNEASSCESSTHVETVSSSVQSVMHSHVQSTETASSSQIRTAGNNTSTEAETQIDACAYETGPSDGITVNCTTTHNIIQSDSVLVQKETFNKLVIQTEKLSSGANDSSSSIHIQAVQNASYFEIKDSNSTINKNGAVNDILTKQAEAVKSDDRMTEQFESDTQVKDVDKLKNCNFNVSETSEVQEKNSLTGSSVADISRNLINCSPLICNGSSNLTQPDKLPLSLPESNSVQMKFETVQSPDTKYRIVDSTQSVTKVTAHCSVNFSSFLDHGIAKYNKASYCVRQDSLENLYNPNIRKAEEESVDDYGKRSITDDVLESRINKTSPQFEFVYSPISSAYSDDADLSHMDTDSGKETENYYPSNPCCGKSPDDAVISKPLQVSRKGRWIEENPSAKGTESSMNIHNNLDSQSACTDITRSSHSVTFMNSGRTDIVPVKVEESAEIKVVYLPPKVQPVNAITALKMRSSLIARRQRCSKGSMSQPVSPLCIDTTQRERSLSVSVKENMYNQRDMSPFSPVNVHMESHIISENTELLTDQRKLYQTLEENRFEVPSCVVSCTTPVSSLFTTSSDFSFCVDGDKSILVKNPCASLDYSQRVADSADLATTPNDDSHINQDVQSTLGNSIQSSGCLIKLPDSPQLKESQVCYSQMTSVDQSVSPAPVFTQTCIRDEKISSPSDSCASYPYLMESPQAYSYVSPGMTRVQIPYREHMIGSPYTAVDTSTTDGSGLTRSSTPSVGSPLACLDPNWFSQQVQNQSLGFEDSPVPSPVNLPCTVSNTIAFPQNQVDQMISLQSSNQIAEMQPDQPNTMHSQQVESFPMQHLTSSLPVGFVDHGQHTGFQSLPIIGHQQPLSVNTDKDKQKILLIHNSSGGLDFLPLGLTKSSKSPQKKMIKKTLNRRSRNKDQLNTETGSSDTNILDRALELSGVFCDGQQQKLNDSAFKTCIIHLKDRTEQDSNYIKVPVSLDGAYPSYVFIQSDNCVQQPVAEIIAQGQGQANLKPSFFVAPVSKMSTDSVMTLNGNIIEFPSMTCEDSNIVCRDLLNQAESELNDLLADIGMINMVSEPVVTPMTEQQVPNVNDVNTAAVIHTGVATESLNEESPGNNLLKETNTSHILKSESSGDLSEINTSVSTKIVLALHGNKTKVMTKEISKDEAENKKHSIDIDLENISELTLDGESLDSVTDCKEEIADPGSFSVFGHLHNNDSSIKSAEKTSQASRCDFQRYRSKENLSEIRDIDLRPSEGVFQSCRLLSASENNISNQNSVLSLNYSSHSTVKPLAEKNQNVTSEVRHLKNSVRSKCDILSQLNQHKLCSQKNTKLLSQINAQNGTSVGDLLSKINQYKHDTINNSMSHVDMDQQLMNRGYFFTDSGKESADSEGLSVKSKWRSHLSRQKNKVGTNAPCTYTINKTGETKFKLCKVLLTSVQKKTNLLQLWRVQKRDGCRLVLTAKKRKASDFPISPAGSISLNTEVTEQPARKRRCLS